MTDSRENRPASDPAESAEIAREFWRILQEERRKKQEEKIQPEKNNQTD
ncbi:MAG: hypothetical protein ACOYUZ_04465 [Patescibacteria group bacterium]